MIPDAAFFTDAVAYPENTNGNRGALALLLLSVPFSRVNSL